MEAAVWAAAARAAEWAADAAAWGPAAEEEDGRKLHLPEVRQDRSPRTRRSLPADEVSRLRKPDDQGHIDPVELESQALRTGSGADLRQVPPQGACSRQRRGLKPVEKEESFHEIS